MTDDESESPRDSRVAEPAAGRWWLRGVLLASGGIVMGALSLALFCFALGVSFSEEGWSENRAVDGPALVGSLVGFAIATLLFWIGFVQTTRATGKNE